ncbi:IS66 family transposase, partial [Microvirga sp. Mcv34]|uniref:IS66 family transposase n=1 Tax=Microvirga sp. Mcv34 TaxID=2926016 RepID=UPI0021C91F68
LHRQSDIYAREGVDLDRSTLAGWVGAMAALLQVVSDRIGTHARSGETVHADDTPVPVLDPGRGQTKTGRLWTVVRDERPWGSAVPPAAFYAYSADRKGEHAQHLLSPCRGFLHADAYAGFDKLYANHPLTGETRLIQVACWAHARRDLYNEFLRNRSPSAERALALISDLFAVEAGINGLDPETRLAARLARSVPLLEILKSHLDTTLARISGKSELAKAIRYMTSRWKALTVYVTDGRLEMSNNAAERAIRPLALGRKNYLFSGSDAGGDRAAVIYTIVETCKMNGINPQAYLADVIERIADHPANRVDELLPWNWTPRS